MAVEGLASAGHIPAQYAPGFDEERDTVLLDLAPSGLIGLAPRGGGPLVFAIRKADLAAGDFSKVRTLAAN